MTVCLYVGEEGRDGLKGLATLVLSCDGLSVVSRLRHGPYLVVSVRSLRVLLPLILRAFAVSQKATLKRILTASPITRAGHGGSSVCRSSTALESW